MRVTCRIALAISLCIAFSSVASAVEPPQDNPVPQEVVSEELQWLAKNIYYEARGEGETGMRAVAHVTMNRVNHPAFPNTIQGVVTQRAQFSWVRMKVSPPRGHLWERSQQIAAEVLAGNEGNPVGNATSFHNTSVHPSWAGRLKFIVKIGRHLFYAH